MKIAVTGKGGVGKTTLAAVLARLYAKEGTVLAADVDPDANLGLALGFSAEELESLVPISHLRDLIAERTGADSSGFGRFFKINPRVDDIPDNFAITKNGVKLLVLGTVETAGTGCVCPEHVVLKRLISHLVLRSNEVIIMDMEAGLEHLGRGTAEGFDRFIVVVEPGARSLQTYRQVRSLAVEMGVENVSVVASKIRTDEDEDFILSNIPAQDFLGFVHWSDEITTADRLGGSTYDLCPSAVAEIEQIKAKIDAEAKL